MSLLTEHLTAFTIKRQVVTNTDAMSSQRTFTTAARGSRPTNMSGRVMKSSTRERRAYGIQDVNALDHILVTTDPEVDNRDQITIAASGNKPARTLYVLNQVNVQELDRLWIIAATESDRGVK